MLSLAQKDLIKEYWTLHNKSLGKTITLDEFTNLHVGVDFAHVEYRHLRQLGQYFAPVTRNQRAYLDEIYEYLGIPCVPSCKTQKEFSNLLVTVSQEHQLFIPKYLHLRNTRYNIEESHADYIIGKQFHLNDALRNMDVIIFKDVLMVDYDNEDYDTLRKLLREQPYTFWVYKTHKGYHCYCMSARLDHRKFASIQYMNRLGCDPVYMSFAKTFGYVVRLTKKHTRKEEFVERFVEQINEYSINERNMFLLEKKDALIEFKSQTGEKRSHFV
jgi:hypothetical protein